MSADKKLINQALLNVFLNSIEAMGENGELLILISSASQHVTITVRDNGSGIPKEALGRVFDPFFTTKEAGTGLGLCITHQIIQQHSGRVEVESRVGVGTAIRFHIPTYGPSNES